MRILPILLGLTQSQKTQDHHAYQQNSSAMVSPANITRVTSVIAQESRPHIVQPSNTQHTQLPPRQLPPPSQVQPHHSQATGTRSEVQARKKSQKRNSGRGPITTTSSTTNTSIPTQTPTTTTQAIVSLFLPNSLRGEKDRSQLTPSNLPTSEEMMNKSSVELRILASKHAKGSTVPPDKQKLIMCLYKELDKYANYGAYRDASGVASGEASKFASVKWNEMSKEEQDSYKVGNQTTNSATSSNTIDSASDANTNTSSTTKEPVYHNAQAKNLSLANTQIAVNNFMIKWQEEARDVAATYEGDFLIIGVSNYLGNYAYQIARGTPRALKWLDNNKSCNQMNHIAAQLQSYVTGTEAGLLMSSKAKVDDRTKCREALSDLIHTRTKRAFEKWPWKGCEQKLAVKGYFIQFDPDSKSQASDITQDNNKILILETEAGPIRNAKRKRNHNSDPDDTPTATSPTVDTTSPSTDNPADHPPPTSNTASTAIIADETPITNNSTTGNTPIADDPPIPISTTAATINVTLIAGNTT
ncbi:uncharacterized protein MELLADRAFT_96022 [Melampsora larici-populina 98AG31]|uniref:Uncharacterized protein n=1 Tax=Melampsora larici-populina (strain 98AG31 / pathotype 3-4-7) TaxID=747676 RepID=F4SAM1_MELLP|nr:uncharacterized protein MELLADRAFT_96022 [Melampsora larici-populina 98AG31]EGF98311.1 hypothetical protein MELLADRAFT_96022 [Melampsora larici-populina 98AG31]